MSENTQELPAGEFHSLRTSTLLTYLLRSHSIKHGNLRDTPLHNGNLFSQIKLEAAAGTITDPIDEAYQDYTAWKNLIAKGPGPPVKGKSVSGASNVSLHTRELYLNNVGR
jgi:hypothetical protein